MKYLLDTNVCIRYLNGESVALGRRLQSEDLQEMAVCSVVKAELFYGAMRSITPMMLGEDSDDFLKLLSHFHLMTLPP